MEEEWTDYDGGAVQERHRNASRIRVTSGVTAIPARSFEDCYELRAVDLSNVATISSHAFRGCQSLESIIWTTASAVEIGVQAFFSCSNLREIDLRNVTKIEEGAFSHCKALESVTIPSSVAEIATGAFFYCDNLANVEFGEGIKHIGGGAFHSCSALVRINIPASVTNIEATAFNGCGRLGEVEFNEGLQHIGPEAFKGCHSLERINVPSSIKFIWGGAFSECTNLSQVTLREGFHYIEGGAFNNCPILEHINIAPAAVVIDIEGSGCQLMRSTMPATAGRLVASKWMQCRSPAQLEQAEAKVNEILGRPHQPEGQKVALIQEWFAYYYRLDVTTMLELAIWRANMDANAQDVEARKATRRNCGNDMTIIIPCVLPFLDHRR